MDVLYGCTGVLPRAMGKLIVRNSLRQPAVYLAGRLQCVKVGIPAVPCIPGRATLPWQGLAAVSIMEPVFSDRRLTALLRSSPLIPSCVAGCIELAGSVGPLAHLLVGVPATRQRSAALDENS